MVEVNLTDQVNDLEEKLVAKFISLNQEAKRAAALLDEKKKELDQIESELLDLLNDENKKSSARFKGIGHVTCLDPIVGNAYILDGQQETLFDYLRSKNREDLIKTSVHHTALASFVGQMLKAGEEAPPGVGYIMKQKLRAYPEK